MARFLKKRTTAYLCLLLSVFITVFGIGGFMLSWDKGEVINAFFEGQHGFSPYRDIKEAGQYAYNLLQVAQQHLPDTNQYVGALKRNLNVLEKAVTPQDYADANRALSVSVEMLYEYLMDDGGLNREGEMQVADRQYLNFGGKVDHLQYDEYYNTKASEFNLLLDEIPAKWIAQFVKVGKMPVFAKEGV